jgi:hypothetical protein
VFELSDGEITLWKDGGIHLKAVDNHGDPVELSEDEAVELAGALIRMVRAG